MLSFKKTAYLTIDDGPNLDFKEKVDYLDSKNILAIWFCLGEALERFPEQAIYAIKKGHIIGNHSYNHLKFSDIALSVAKEQIMKTDSVIEAIYTEAGTARPIKVFRFPFLNNGSRDEHGECKWNNEHVKAIQEYLKELGYIQPKFEDIHYSWYKNVGFESCINVDCTYDTFDWCLAEHNEKFGYHDLPTVLGRIDEDVPEEGRGLNYMHSNEIVMMHAWIPMEAFKALIEKIMNKGIVFKLPDLQ